MPPFSESERLLLWGLQYTPKHTSIIVFLPNGIMQILSCSKETTLECLKNDVWNLAVKDVLYRVLKPKSCYLFTGVTETGINDIFYDETKRIYDLRLFHGCLRLIEPKGNKDETVLNSNISFAIGRSLDELENSNDSEANQFRIDIIHYIEKMVKMREQSTDDERLKYFYPNELDDYYYLIKKRFKQLEQSTDEQLEKLKLNDSVADDHKKEKVLSAVFQKVFPKQNQNLKSKNITAFEQPTIINDLSVCVWYVNELNSIKLKHEFKIESELKPDQLIDLCSNKFNNDGINLKEHRYLLKVCGIDQYLLDNQPILRYKYIVECISKEVKPQLCIVKCDDVINKIPRTNFIVPTFLNKLIYQQKNDHSSHYDQNPSLWKQTDKFVVFIHSITYINITNIDKFYIKAGLYHGLEPLCKSVDTKQVDAEQLKWNGEELVFDINMVDIPRNAKICFAVCGTSKKRPTTQFAIKWANLQLFDYYKRLVSGRCELTLFQMPENIEDSLPPLFPLGNVNAKSLEITSSLNVEFRKNKIVFPKEDVIYQYGKWAIDEIEKRGKSYGHKNEKKNRFLPNTKMNDEEERRFNDLLKKDQLSIISDDDKDFLWRWRLECKEKNPDSLPKLIDSIKWNSRDETAQLFYLLKDWKQVQVETALELLDCKYSDNFVRSCAVNWLNQSITDEQLYQYLLQLVQVLKYEPYFDNELTRFLIRKSLLNRKIGHYFFWHIKAEMNDPSYYTRFSLILEAYCRGIGGDLLNETIRQVDALNMLSKLTENFKMSKIDNNQRKKSRFLVDHLQRDDFKDALKDLRNPLNCTIKLEELEIKSCQIMDSSKKPLWLVWNTNTEHSLLKNTIIFKSGDDLRQDMLTIQVIKIINFIWRSEGFDLKMIPYTCLATGKQVGMIEVITNAETVMNIQKQRGMMAALQVDSKQLYKWIKEKNRNNYDKAIDNFTRSCAGYCVATFILGIGDRNPANIMIKEDGHIFHIDFGHFLGHYKKKLGITRERVPFVLAPDFIRVIAKGAENPKNSPEFEKFGELCGKAYLSLRKHANLLITLFTMMLYTGIPELQSIEDIDHLRTTLQVGKSELDAIQYFNSKFLEAYDGSWSTKLDWFFHHVAHM